MLVAWLRAEPGLSDPSAPFSKSTHRPEDLHRVLVGVGPGELLVDLQHPFELLAHRGLARRGLAEVRHVQVGGLLALRAVALVDHRAEDLPRRDVPRDEVAVPGIALLEEVVPLGLGDVPAVAAVLAVLRHPDAAALAEHALGDEPKLVGRRDGRRVHLDELSVGVDRALLVGDGGGRSGVDHRVGAAAEDQAGAPGGEAHGVAAEGAHLAVLEVLGDYAAADARLVEHEAREVPELELPHHLLAGQGDAAVVLHVEGLVAPHLLVEGVEQLLPGGRPGEGRAVEERPPEAAEIQVALGGAVEGHAHAVEHEDDPWRRVRHALARRLVGEEVAALHGLVEVRVRRVAFALHVHRRVDAALSADRVRALHRDQRDQVHRDARLAELDHGHQAAEAAADDDGAAHLGGLREDRGLRCHP